ncbi:MAG: tetratricopeptide repeat-containing sulfotransferase family protein [Rhodanobacteraceae bacterium]
MQASAPASLEAQMAAAKALYQANQPARAEASLRALRDREPAREEVAMLLADVQRSQGRLTAASETLLTVCGANTFEPRLSVRCVEFVRQCDRHEVAAQICEGALARGPVSPDLLVLAGHVARELGDFATARTRYMAALDAGVDLERNHVLGALANTKRYADPGDSDLARCERHFRDAAFSARSRASAGFGLAKIRDDLGDYASAAKTLRESNAMVSAVARWNTSAWLSFVDMRLRERIASEPNEAAKGFVPVFIVGVPRTGTTLAASLLARATRAHDRGELRSLRFIGERLVAGGHLHDANALAEAANLYRTLAVQDDAPAACYLDQDPLNFRWLHIAAAMFPQARVIHLRRDPRDTALSLWSQDFAHPDLAFAYDFDDMAAYMRGHDALMRHWAQSLSLPIFELDYEALVTKPQASLAKLRDFIGAPAIEPDALQSRAGQGAPVQSASVWQARQPVYSTSVGRWRHYASYAPELESFKAETLLG